VYSAAIPCGPFAAPPLSAAMRAQAWLKGQRRKCASQVLSLITFPRAGHLRSPFFLEIINTKPNDLLLKNRVADH